MRQNFPLPTPPSLRPLPSTPAKLWHLVSLTLTITGLILMGWGGWTFLQNQIEASQPPPARIIEVDPDNLVEPSGRPNIPAPETNPAREISPERKPVAVSELTTQTVLSLADNPLPAVEPELAAPVEAKPVSPPTEFETAVETAPPETRPEPASALEPVAKTAPSLADNPLPVVELQEVTQPPPESASDTGQPEAAADDFQAALDYNPNFTLAAEALAAPGKFSLQKIGRIPLSPTPKL